ncbi:MAG TPA: toll/interleukin-1 receptor domain-containing protein [Ktedonobacteraceae bacterium]
MGASIDIFFGYAHKDKEPCERLEKFLNPLKRQGVITTWHEGIISAGSERKREIDRHLNTAHIILLLVSPDFLASNYCYDVEMKRAMQRHECGEACVIPILLRPADWKSTPLQRLQALPTDGKPVTEWKQQDKAFDNIVTGIKKVVWELQEQPGYQKGKQQKKSKSVPAPKNNRMDNPVAGPSAQNKQPRAQAVAHEQPSRSIQQTNNIGQVTGIFSGGINTIHGIDIIQINTMHPAEDVLAKARSEAARGYKALKRKDYIAAKRCLETADLTLAEDELPTESAQIKYYMAIALLNGYRPFSDAITRSAMEHIEQILNAAIKLRPLHSYYYTLALLKRDFARHGLPRYKEDAQNLLRKARRINPTQVDNENLHVLTICQPRLVNDAQRW